MIDIKKNLKIWQMAIFSKVFLPVYPVVLIIVWTCCSCLFSNHLFSEETTVISEKAGKDKKADDFKEALKEQTSETTNSVMINGVELNYKALAGNILLRNDQHQPKASIFYVAYFKEGVQDPSDRPLIFCFNGGPGSSSVWLHMGLFGPRRVLLNEEGTVIPPYQIVNNEYSILDFADLVFIDPVSTGYSRPAPGEDAKKYHGVDEDIESIGEFIRQFITYYERWDSPKLLAGESYGTTRAAGLAIHLHDEQGIYLNGIILISSILNFQTLFDYNKGNDLPYPLYLPTYTTTALYHKKLNEELQKDFNKTLEEAKQFALTDYTLALMKGNAISKEEHHNIVQKLATYTGLSHDFIERSNLRINPYRFCMELLKSNNLTVGRFDTRITGESLDATCDYPGYDPSFEEIIGAFTAAFNQYVRQELKVKNDREYKILSNISSTWNYSKATNQFLNMASSLNEVMIKNMRLKIFVASGRYDLATPFFATDYTFNHLRPSANIQENVNLSYYDAGHMMFIQKASLIKMKNDLATWMKSLQDK